MPGGGYTFAAGTSIAAPFVSGSAALLLSVAQERLNRTLGTEELKQLLMDAAEPLPGLKGKTASGARLRTDWALQSLLGKRRSRVTPCLQRPGAKPRKCKGKDQRRRRMLSAWGGRPQPLGPPALEATDEAHEGFDGGEWLGSQRKLRSEARWAAQRAWEQQAEAHPGGARRTQGLDHEPAR